MKKKEQINFFSGKTTFLNKEVNYEIEGFVMRIFARNETIRDLFFIKDAKGVYSLGVEKKPLPVKNLTCYTNDGRYYLSVFFGEYNYSAANIMTVGITTIIIYFHHLIVTNLFSLNPTRDNYLGIVSDKYYKFLCMVPHYHTEEIDKPNFSVSLEFPSKQMVATLNYKNYTIEVHPFASWSCSFSTLDYKPGLSFRFNSIVMESDIVSFVDNWQKLTRFLFMRNNIYPDLIDISMGVYNSILYVWKPKQEQDQIEDIDSIYTDSISWDLIYQYIPKLFELICDDNLYLFHLKDSIRERLSVNVYNAGLDAAAFEFEFGKLYPDGIKHKEKKLLAEKEANEEIGALYSNSTGEKRKIYKKIKAHIRSESLCDMMELAFDDNNDCLVQLKNKYAKNLDYETISKVCSDFRNDIDHGNKHGDLDDCLVSCFIMLRGLIYAMQLKRVGVNSDQIDIIVNKLFNLKP